VLGRKDKGPRAGLIRPAGPHAEPLDASAANGDGEQPTPQPERREPKLQDPGLRDLSTADYKAILKRAAKESLDDGITDLAAALAYYSFMAIPAVLLVVTGLFTLIASPQGIQTLMQHLGKIVPAQTTELLNTSLQNLANKPSSSIVITIVGFVLALWTTTGAMTAFMRALNRAYDRKETRGFVKQRIVALEMVAVMGVAFLLVFGLLVLGPPLSNWVGNAVHAHGLVTTLWWVLQWPVLFGGLLVAFATLLYLGPDVDHPKFEFITPGAVVAAVVWIAVSGLFAVYTSMFGSYNKTWGSLAAVIVMLTWLWLTGLALLFAAEINAEAERSRELRRKEPAGRELTAPAKG
jgi:membrane protein